MLKNLVRYFAVMTGAAALAVLASCEDKTPDNSPKEPLELSRSTIQVGNDAEDVFIGVTARDAGWTMTGDESWCRVTPGSGDKGVSQITVKFLANDDPGAVTRTATLVFVSGTNRKEIAVEQLDTKIINPNQDPEYGINEIIHEAIIDEWYLWNEETKATRADYNQGYDSFFKNYLTYLNGNGMDGNVWSYDNTRYLYSYIQRNTTATAALAPLDYGMEFELLNYDGKFVGRVLYVSKGSPAEAQGLKRGNWFYKVNDMLIDDSNYTQRIDTLVHPIQGESVLLGMLTFRSSDKTLTDNKVTVTVTPARYRRNPILGDQIITQFSPSRNSPKTGYLAYNGFDPLFEAELRAVFAKFKSDPGGAVTQLVLDLRYNKSGTVEMAKLMADLIVPSSAASKEFARLEFNNDKSAKNTTLYFTPEASTLGLTTVYILCSPYTAGPAELLINALRKLDGFKLVLIGDTTEGMNVGMVKRSRENNGYKYDVYPVAFRVSDGTAAEIYRYGMLPMVSVSEWEGDNIKWRDEFGWSSKVGVTEDPLLKTAMNYIMGDTQIPENSIIDNTSHQRSWPRYSRDFSVQMSMTMDVPE